MHSAPDLITRWPALEVAAKRARLQNSLHVSPGPLRDSVNAAKATAIRVAPDRTTDWNIALTLTSRARTVLPGADADADAILTLIQEGDYFALLAYLGPDPALAAELQTLRRAVRDRTRAATMLGYGPRYLHSTGQLHKGGPNSGVFLVISATPREDLAIPAQPFSFGTLEHAQAVGDFAALDAAGRRGLHARLSAPDPALLREVSAMLLARLMK